MFNLIYKSTDLSKWNVLSQTTINQHIVLAHIFGSKGEKAIYVTSEDEVFAVGDNECGCLGSTAFQQKLEEPFKIEELCNKKIQCICSGNAHCLSYTAEGHIYSWGDNSNGQLGDGSTKCRAKPKRIQQLKDIQHISAGGTFSLAMESTNLVWFWGTISKITKTYDIPIKVEFGNVSNIIYLTNGWNYIVALSENGKVFTWGDGHLGTLGHGIPNESHLKPKQVTNLSGNIIKVACGEFATIALNESGDVYGWGHNEGGCLAVGNTDVIIYKPAKVILREPVTDIAASIHHQIFAAENQQTGNIFIWGRRYGTVHYSAVVTIHCSTLFEAFCDFATPITIKAQIPDDFDNIIDSLTETEEFLSVKDLDLKFINGKLLINRKIPIEMFNNEEMSDFIIKLNGCDLFAHKVILNYFSEHFRNMFKGQWKENKTCIADMTNYNAVAYQSYIKFVYTGIIEEIDASDMFDLYLIAKEYSEHDLACECLQYLSEAVNIGNVAILFASAWRNKCQEVIDICIKESAKNFDAIILGEGFKALTNQEILSSFCRLTAAERNRKQNL
ncbi:hypothetical protein O3M35_008604 [Rhynocoris fuscipes]|uniref:BTB domain-containing protein n=1 Tax=Rhynocoris fuscipes TaxID=488301 RepID=A0AAW1D6T1_9HEMI